MFDGSTLKGWDGSSEVWRVENGAITGESTPEKPSGTTYVIWLGGEPRNFELKAEIKLEGGGANSGIQYRSARAAQPQGGPVPNPRFAKWNLKGYQRITPTEKRPVNMERRGITVARADGPHEQEEAAFGHVAIQMR